MTGLAAFLDPRALLPALLVMAFTGGAMALVAAIRKHAIRHTFNNTYTLLLSTVTLGRHALFSGWRNEKRANASEGSVPGAITNPYGVAIAAGALAGWFL